MIDPNTRLIDMTVGDLMDLFKSMKGAEEAPTPQRPTLSNKRLVYGIAGIAQLFNCSMSTANRIKASGIIDKAISQHGRIITIDADLALELLKSNA